MSDREFQIGDSYISSLSLSVVRLFKKKTTYQASARRATEAFENADIPFVTMLETFYECPGKD